ncbi:thermonuclease family protein [Ectothiorhodospiraceae bacterium BW-2]|nr:thermonuclease family protein [Ectothiorhodospiraceae bacterium BW-2]
MGKLGALWCSLLLLPLLSCTPPSFDNRLNSCRVERIYDGDTMTLNCNGEKTKVRFHCIDTPEMGQVSWGKKSRDHLRDISPDRVDVIHLGTDRYGRVIGNVLDKAGDSLNLRMVREGYAAVYPQYCEEKEFFAAQGSARSQNLGIWKESGLHQQPWLWRKAQREEPSWIETLWAWARGALF